jgi:histidyl-tRNA synthetase
MSVISGPKGTRDFYPEDMAFREHIFSSWHATCKRYGFELYDGPMFEHLELFTQKSGDEIEKQLYTFEDKGGRRMALRPELTPTLARMVASKGTNLKRPVRWYSIPRLFRYERMQKGRLREFFQLNMDILGVKDVSADAELIAAVIDMMRDLGFTDEDFTVHISSRTLLEELFIDAGIARENLGAMYNLLDKKHKIPPEEFSTELSALAGSASQQERINRVLSIQSLADASGINPSMNALKDLQDLFSLLEGYGMSRHTFRSTLASCGGWPIIPASCSRFSTKKGTCAPSPEEEGMTSSSASTAAPTRLPWALPRVTLFWANSCGKNPAFLPFCLVQRFTSYHSIRKTP